MYTPFDFLSQRSSLSTVRAFVMFRRVVGATIVFIAHAHANGQLQLINYSFMYNV